jgi:hypothetical protein
VRGSTQTLESASVRTLVMQQVSLAFGPLLALQHNGRIILQQERSAVNTAINARQGVD